jgi:hypothetical protein
MAGDSYQLFGQSHNFLISCIHIMVVIRKQLLDLTHARALPAPLKKQSDGPKWGEIAEKLMKTDLTMLFNQL